MPCPLGPRKMGPQRMSWGRRSREERGWRGVEGREGAREKEGEKV